MCWESVGCPAAQHKQWFGVSAGFLQERQVQLCIGFGGVSHVSLDKPRCVSCRRRKTQTSVMAFCGVQRMESEVCWWSFSKYHSLAVPLPPMIVFLFAVVDGIVKICRMRILRNCPYRGTLSAFGACTASRTSHSPSSLRAWDCAVFLKLHLG